MIIKQSPLKHDSYFITRLELDFEDPEDYEGFDNEVTVENYVVDVDFAIKRIASDTFHVFVKTDVNNKISAPLPGYSISAECLGIFKLTETIEDPEIVKRLVNNSALVMTINYLRAYISNATTPMPWGPYFLPSIDMQDLYAKKTANMRAQNAPKANVKKAKAKKK